MNQITINSIWLLILLIISILQIVLTVFIFSRLRLIEITKEVQIITKPKKEKPFIPIVVKPKKWLGNTIINEMKNARIE